ncbi:GumC family protein [Halochromatium glycolicum]|uniref:Tyrosine kinase G-rich domain-containing protein n=1 Tax=Halochromatium glycolicum TaxID=85075 RepID=A0AAJ0U1K2_9GAMM|nr:Wzz/FepE/Etk N-terminal domain-containing protein [Halochromatium glycolicum]MBK1703180.1 hypothetical protein [Halochromatium glycolicum]
MTHQNAEIGTRRTFGLREHVQVLSRHAGKIILIPLVGFVTALAISFSVSEVYVAEARLLVQLSREPFRLSAVLNPNAVNTVPRSAEDELRTEVEIFKSPVVAQKLADRLGPEYVVENMTWRWDWLKKIPAEVKDRVLITLYDWGPTARLLGSLGVERPISGPPDWRTVAAGKILDNIEVGTILKTDIFVVSLAAPDGDFAALALNTMLEAYFDHHSDLRQPRRALEVLAEEAERLREAVDDAQRQLHDFKREHGIASLDDQKSVLVRRIDTIEAEVSNARVAAISGQKGIQAIERQLSALGNTTLGGSVYSELQKRLALERAEVAAAEARAEALSVQLAQERATLAMLDAREAELNSLTMQVDIRRQALDAFVKKQFEMQTAESFDTQKLANVRPVEPAQVPPFPSKPRKALNAILGLVIGGIIALTIAYLSEYMRRTLITRQEAEEVLRRQVPAVLRWEKPSKRASRLNELEFRRFAEALEGNGESASPRCVLITSAVSGEGRSFAAHGLAAALRARGKSVLVLSVRTDQTFDSDCPESKGSGSQSSTNVISDSESDVVVGRGAELLRDHVRSLRRDHAAELDYILVDAPDMNRYPEQQTLVPETSDVIFVIEAGRTSSMTAWNELEAIDSAKPTRVVVVLNKWRPAIPEWIYARLKPPGRRDDVRQARN